MFTYINLINLIIYLESVIMAQAFAFSQPKRKFYWLRVVLSTVVGAAITYLFPFFSFENFWFRWLHALLMYAFIMGVVLCSVVVCVKSKLNGYLFCALGGYALHHLASTLDSVTRPFLFASSVRFSDLPYALFHFGIVATLYTIIFIYFVKNKKIEQLMSHKRVVFLTAVIILLNIVISSLGMFSDSSTYLPVPVVDIYNFVSSWLAIIILFNMMNREYLEKEIEVINNLYKENIRQYEISKATMASLHDLKHRLNAVMNRKIELSEKEKKEINDKIFVFDSMAKTGNETLDIILSEKMMLCNQYGIDFSCIANGKLLSFMDTYDIFSLFGNAISNAIEAVCRDREGKTKLISLVIKGVGSYLSIHLENTFDGQIIMTNGLPETNKTDKMSHGFGIKSMYNIINKYDGALTITIEDNVFILDIALPLKQS